MGPACSRTPARRSSPRPRGQGARRRGPPARIGCAAGRLDGRLRGWTGGCAAARLRGPVARRLGAAGRLATHRRRSDRLKSAKLWPKPSLGVESESRSMLSRRPRPSFDMICISFRLNSQGLGASYRSVKSAARRAQHARHPTAGLDSKERIVQDSPAGRNQAQPVKTAPRRAVPARPENRGEASGRTSQTSMGFPSLAPPHIK